MRLRPSPAAVSAALPLRPDAAAAGGAHDAMPAALPAEALDDRIAIVGTAGSGKTHAAKGFVERLLEGGARVAIVDPLGVWWGLRASADGSAPGYPVAVFGGCHADVPITAEMGAALGRLIAVEALACVVDLSELGNGTARRRFMAAFSEAVCEANAEPVNFVRVRKPGERPEAATPHFSAFSGMDLDYWQRYYLLGTAEQIAERISLRIAALDGRIDHIILNPLDWSGEQLELIAHEVLPRVMRPARRRPLAAPDEGDVT